MTMKSKCLRLGRELIILIALSTLLISISTLIHLPIFSLPSEIMGMQYSDIVYGVFLDIFGPENIDRPVKLSMRWYNTTLFMLLATGEVKYCPLPYIDYFLEYPPVVALIMFFSSCSAFTLVLPQKYNYLIYSRLIIDIAQYHLILNALVIFVFTLLMVIYMLKLIRLLNLRNALSRVFIMLFLPSFIVYSVYNWDIIASSLFIISLYYLCKRKYVISSLIMGLSILTKLLPLTFVVIFSLSCIFRNNFIIKSSKELFKYVLPMTLLILLTVLPIQLVSPEVLADFLFYHGKWYCENCLYQVFIRDLESPLHRLLALLSMLLVIIISSSRIKVSTRVDILKLALIAVIASTTLNYIFTPQMILLIAPLALLLLNKYEVIMYVIADVANTLMMILFFMDEELRKLINTYLYLNLDVVFNPWSIDSPIQWFAMIRNSLLLILLVKLILGMSTIKSKTTLISNIQIN